MPRRFAAGSGTFHRYFPGNVSTDSGPVAVSSPDISAVLQFSVTNTGNGEETFRLFTDNAVSGNDFNPAVTQLYLESNTLPGLQIVPGGDTAYLQTSNDPLLLDDETILVYVVSSIPDLLASNDTGALPLRAASTTVIAQSGATGPADAGFPVPGTDYADAGDPDDAGTGNVTAGVDNTGFNAGTTTVTVSLGDVAGGTPVITITFDAAIR